MMEIEPVDREFEAASEWLVGKRRRGESAVEWMHRVVRVRELLRAEQKVRRVEALAERLENGFWVNSLPMAEAIRSALDGAA